VAIRHQTSISRFNQRGVARAGQMPERPGNFCATSILMIHFGAFDRTLSTRDQRVATANGARASAGLALSTSIGWTLSPAMIPRPAPGRPSRDIRVLAPSSKRRV
jgi:hypothetical protein